MKGDALASGANKAQFSAGHASKDEPIKYNYTVAEEEAEKVTDEEVKEVLQSVNPVRYQPMNDRVLLRPIEEKKEGLVVTPDAYAEPSYRGEVISVGDGMIIGGELRPIPLVPGDIVRYGKYAFEPLELNGEKVGLVSAFEIRLKEIREN